MLVRFTKNPPSAPADTFHCVRPDGTTTQGPMPRQGILPHEAFHFVVESTLGWRDAFFGQLARGAAHERLTARLHGSKVDRVKHAQALQSEALIECLDG